MWPWQYGQAKDDESFGFGDCQRDCHFRSSLICIIHLFSTVLPLSTSSLSISAIGRDQHCPSFILVVVHSEGIGNNILQALRTQAPCHPIGEDMMIMNWWWRQKDNDNVIMMTRLYEGTSASDTFDGRCVGHRLKVNFPPSWQKEFQIYSLKMKTHLEISNCRRNQAILYRLLTIRSNLP